jgi:hypothetical protein
MDLQDIERQFRLSFNHLVGKLMHISGILRPDLPYTCMRFSGYMACPNKPIFDALHHTMCYLYHHPHLPIMYPSKPTTPTGDALQIFWSKGHAECLSSDYGDALTTFTDADHAICLCTQCSVSAFFVLYNDVAVSLFTALHSTGSEITALHKGATKTILLRSFLTSIGQPLTLASPTYEDNQGTINSFGPITLPTLFDTMLSKLLG